MLPPPFLNVSLRRNIHRQPSPLSVRPDRSQVRPPLWPPSPSGSCCRLARPCGLVAAPRPAHEQRRCICGRNPRLGGAQVKEAPPTPEKRVVARPGVPAPTRLSAFVVPDRPSPVQRLPDKDGHYVFELGENLSSRCAPSLCFLPWRI